MDGAIRMIMFILGLIHTVIYTIALYVSKIFLVIAYVIVLLLGVVVVGCGLLLLIETVIAKLSKDKKII